MAGSLEHRGDADVVVSRPVDTAEEDLLDELTEFAVANDLEVDRSDAGEGLVFRPRREPNAEAAHLFQGRDWLRVVITPEPDGHSEVVITANMVDLHARGDGWKQRMRFRSVLVSGIFLSAGVAGLSHGVNPGDFVPLGLGGWFALRGVRRVQGESESRDAILRDVHNTLERVLDDIERASDLDA